MEMIPRRTFCVAYFAGVVLGSGMISEGPLARPEEPGVLCESLVSARKEKRRLSGGNGTFVSSIQWDSTRYRVSFNARFPPAESPTRIICTGLKPTPLTR